MKTLRERLDFTGMKRWLIQAVFIVFAVLLSIITVTWILEKSLVRQALELEADAFIEEYRKDKDFPLPRTRNLIGYLQTSGMPAGAYPGNDTYQSPGALPGSTFWKIAKNQCLCLSGTSIINVCFWCSRVPMSIGLWASLVWCL